MTIFFAMAKQRGIIHVAAQQLYELDESTIPKFCKVDEKL